MNWLADLVLAVHTVFILFVVGGQTLILAGWALGWSWPRHRWFRLLHLLAIGFVMRQVLRRMKMGLFVTGCAS